MVDQTKIAGELASKLGNQLLNQSRAERDSALEEIKQSQQFQHLQEIADEDRLDDKIANTLENEKLQDKVHISDRAQALYRAREAELDNTPERVHSRLQGEKQEAGLTPEATAFETFNPES